MQDKVNPIYFQTTGSDTIVTHNGKIYEKPADVEDAVRFGQLFFFRLTQKYLYFFRIISTLSGSTHTVFSGVSLVARDTNGQVLIQTIRVNFFKFFFLFQIFSCIFFPYQVERTTFFEGTDVEFAQLSEQVICMLAAIVFAL